MDRDREEGRLLKLAQELARTGRYRSVEEVEEALRLQEPEASLANKLARGVIDGTCYRVRREKGLDT